MSLNLGETYDNFIGELLATGRYESHSEILRDALRLLKEREDLKKLRLVELQQQIAIGIEQADRGELLPFDIEVIKHEAQQQTSPK